MGGLFTFILAVLLILIVLAGLIILVGGYFWYIALVSRRNRTQEALSSIDVQLRKRHDLLPATLKLANQFMAHERSLIQRLTELRVQAQQPYDPGNAQQVQTHLEAEQELQAGLKRIFMVAENYPELRSSDTIVQAQQTFLDVEEHIAASRRFYNAAVTRLNNAVQIFPGSFIARLTNIQVMPFFELEDEAMRNPIDVDQYLNGDNS